MIRYYPVLKWKKGEQLALKNLTSEQQKGIMPIIELVDPTSPEEFFNTLQGISCPVYIDTENIDSNEYEYLTSIVEQARENDKPVYPVIPVSLVEAKTPKSSLLERCLFKIPVIPEEDEPNVGEIIEKIKALGVAEYGVILDIGPSVKREFLGLQRTALLTLLTSQKDFLLGTRAVIVCTSSFPSDISDIGGGEERQYKRYDFSLFYRTVSALEGDELLHKLAYADYGVSKYTETELDFSRLRYGILPKIKYSTPTEYIVLKGKRQQGILTISYKELAQTILNAPYYSGREFSYGDECIYNIANSADKSGNSTNWVTYCANHHIVLVLGQISSLF